MLPCASSFLHLFPDESKILKAIVIHLHPIASIEIASIHLLPIASKRFQTPPNAPVYPYKPNWCHLGSAGWARRRLVSSPVVESLRSVLVPDCHRSLSFRQYPLRATENKALLQPQALPTVSVVLQVLRGTFLALLYQTLKYTQSIGTRTILKSKDKMQCPASNQIRYRQVRGAVHRSHQGTQERDTQPAR